MNIKWSETPPPPQTVVMAQYSSDPNKSWKALRSCKRGCCVDDGLHTMTLPDYWREATLEEIKVWDSQQEHLKEMKPQDYWD